MKIIKRSLFLITCLILLSQTFILAFDTEYVQNISNNGQNYIADETTVDDYKTILMDEDTGTASSGRIWADKSVYTKIPSSASTSIEIDGQNFNFDNDFCEVFSLLGSTHTTKGLGTNPIDLVVTVDLSKTMGEKTNLEKDNTLGRIPLKIDETVKSLNKIFNYILELNEENRIGLVGFAGKAVELLPLGRYQRVGESDMLSIELFDTGLATGQSFIFTVSALDENNNPINKSLINTTKSRNDKDVQATFIDETTNLQDGLIKSSDIFLNSVETTNTPKLLVVSDGQPNAIMKNNWMNSEEIRIDRLDSDQYYPAVLLSTLLTASYRKAAVQKFYNQPLEVIALGIDLLESEYEPYINGSLKPHMFFNAENSDNLIKQAYDLWLTWLSKGSIDFSKISEINLNTILSDLPEDNPYGLTKEDLINNIQYTNSYFEVSSDNQLEIFQDVVQGFDETTFDLLNDSVGPENGIPNSITYIDPIGSYIELKEIKNLSLFGNLYELNQDKTNLDSTTGTETTSYRILSTNRLITNENCPEPTSFNLDDLQINYVKESDGNSYIKLTIPEAAIPVIKTNIIFSSEFDKFGDRLISEFNTTENSKFSKPLRLIYTLGVKDNILDEDKLINLDLVDVDYIHTNLEDNAVSFYSNGYSKETTLIENEISSIGDAYISFIPSDLNPFYINQEEKIIYQKINNEPIDKNTIISEKDFKTLSQLKDIDNNLNYFIESTFYKKDGEKNSDNPGITYKKIETVKGSDIKNSIDYLRNNGNSLGIASGNKYNGSIIPHSNSKSDNKTGTATLKTFLKDSSENKENKEFRNYLGNNAKIAVTGASPKIILEKYQAIGSEAHKKDPLNVTAWDIISYQFQLVNTTPTDCKDVVVTDYIPQGLLVDTDSITEGGTYNEGVITWNIPVLSGNSQVFLEFKVTVPDISAGNWTNVGYFDYPDRPTIENNMSNEVYASAASPIIDIEKFQAVNTMAKTQEIQSVIEGDTVTYFFKVTNVGSEPAENVVVYDNIPEELEPEEESISSNGVLENNTITWVFNTLNPLEEKMVSFSVKIPEGSKSDNWKNIAYASSNEIENPIPSNEVEINRNLTDLEIIKTQSINNITPTTEDLIMKETGDITYFIEISNKGGLAYKNINVIDPIPPGLEIDSTSITNNGTISNNSILWQIEELQPGDTIKVGFRASISDVSLSNWSNTAELYTDSELTPIYSNTVNIKKSTVELLNSNTIGKDNVDEIVENKTNGSSKTTNIDNYSPKTGIESTIVTLLLIIIISSVVYLFNNFYENKNMK